MTLSQQIQPQKCRLKVLIKQKQDRFGVRV